MTKKGLVWLINYHKSSAGFDYTTVGKDLAVLGLSNVRDVYAYKNTKGVYQYWIVEKPKNKFIVCHFVYTTGVADWIEKKRIKEGEKPTQKRYWQNVAIDFDTRKEANDFIVKDFTN